MGLDIVKLFKLCFNHPRHREDIHAGKHDNIYLECI